MRRRFRDRRGSSPALERGAAMGAGAVVAGLVAAMYAKNRFPFNEGFDFDPETNGPAPLNSFGMAAVGLAALSGAAMGYRLTGGRLLPGLW